MAEPEKDEHIEELLSKLQGIFGKLSHSEEEPEEIKIDIPIPAPPAKKSPAPPAAVESSSVAPIMERTLPLQAVKLTVESQYISMVPTEDPEKNIVPTALFFPPGRETEGKAVAEKLETMAPKFTKIAFRLRVQVFMPYDPRSEWKDAIAQKAAEAGFKTAFVLMERPLDDTKRKQIAGELEERGVYFQEVLTSSIEKKAFYTDVLLGLVFFFDSHKPSTEPGTETPAV